MSHYHTRSVGFGPPFAQGGPSLPIVYEPASPARWEYRVITLDPREDEPLDEAALAVLGGDGWLLAGILPNASGDSHPRIHYYFVRAA
ncbi:MAG: hypothetical protein ACHQ4H_05505 [Ktedonobacterales bacterium]|jgi:hypothetical protein